MAYKMAPKGGNNAKTGHGIPMTFRQDGPKQMKFIKNAVETVGSAISNANEAGKKAYANSRKGTSYLGDMGGGASGSGPKRDYEQNPIEYVKGFVGNLMSGEEANPKTPAKPKGPKQTKKATPKKEKGFLDTVSDYASNAVETVSSAISNANKAGQEAYANSRKGTSYLGDFGGGASGSGPKRDYEQNPIEYVKGFVGNIMSGEDTKPKVKSKGPKQMKAKKKVPAKMKKC